MITKITSRDNKILKTARSLHKKKGREQTGMYFAEGRRLVGEAIEYIFDKIHFILVSDSYSKIHMEELESLDSRGKGVYIAEDKLFCDACATQTPQGIAAIIDMPDRSTINYSECEYILVLDGVAEPGNMGTIIRTAEAAGIDAVCLMNGCTDIYAPKVVRSAMGSLFRMRFINADTADIEKMKNSGFFVAATALYNSQPIENVSVSGKRAIIIGSEAHGVSSELVSLADVSVRIDMKGSVESLNAAVAAGIAMYMLKV